MNRCHQLQNELDESSSSMSSLFSISADRNTLSRQFEESEESLKEAMARNLHTLPRKRKEHQDLEDCCGRCEDYYFSLQEFSNWLSENEKKMEQTRPIQPVSSKDLEELDDYRRDISMQKEALEEVKSLGVSFLEACTADRLAVEIELFEIEHRFETLKKMLEAQYVQLQVNAQSRFLSLILKLSVTSPFSFSRVMNHSCSLVPLSNQR